MSSLSMLNSFLPALPLCVVWTVGLILSIVRWKMHPGVSRLTLIACLLLLFTNIFGSGVWVLIISMQANFGWSATQMGYAFAALSLGRTGLSTVGYALLLIAVFGWRRQTIDRPPPLDVRFPDEPEDSDAIRRPY